MKKIFRNLMMLLCALTALVSCDESGDKIYLDGIGIQSDGIGIRCGPVCR